MSFSKEANGLINISPFTQNRVAIYVAGPQAIDLPSKIIFDNGMRRSDTRKLITLSASLRMESSEAVVYLFRLYPGYSTAKTLI